MLEKKWILNSFSQFISKKTHNWKGDEEHWSYIGCQLGFPTRTETKRLHLQQGTVFQGETTELVVEDKVPEPFSPS